MRDRVCVPTASGCSHLQHLLDAEHRLREAVVLAREQMLHCEHVLDQLARAGNGSVLRQRPRDASCVCREVTSPIRHRDDRDDVDGAPSTVAPTAMLTPRETEVLHLIAAGMSNRQIADRLFLSPRTIERHIANIYLKLNVHTKADATAWARCLWLTTNVPGAQGP